MEIDTVLNFKQDEKGNYCECGNYGKIDKYICICDIKEIIKYQKKLNREETNGN